MGFLHSNVLEGTGLKYLSILKRSSISQHYCMEFEEAQRKQKMNWGCLVVSPELYSCPLYDVLSALSCVEHKAGLSGGAEAGDRWVRFPGTMPSCHP